jgi:hypothetical protein
MDPYGDVIDLNCMDFSFSIEITEVLNIKLYDFYRNYILTDSELSLYFVNTKTGTHSQNLY